jgi:hypothetical protein
MLDVQESILDADLILCEMSGRNPNVFYELGLAHAVGKPAILVSRREEDVPFDLRHVRVILYDYSRPGWEPQLIESITAAARAVTETSEVWPPPLTATKDRHTELRALASEIAFNLTEIDTFLSHGYEIDDEGRVTADGKPTTLRYVTCMTNQFETAAGHQRIADAGDEVRDAVFRVYRAFREINTRADALRQAFRPWRAHQYFEAIEEFQARHREVAERLAREL